MKFIFKIIHFLKFLTVIDLSIIKKSKILIYCPLNFKGIKKITKTKYQLMHKPQDSSNLYILMKMFFNLEFKLIDYLIYYIDRVSPKLIITTYDNDRYCPELFMEFRYDGTFLDYWSLSSSGCEENQYSGTWSVQDGYYELVYIEGGSNALTASDIYIIFTDDNTMEYDYVNAVYTYKREL